MTCTKCWYIHERDYPYRPDVWGKLSKGDIEELNKIIDSLEHSLDCKLSKTNGA